ncbi:MAG: hypothetical protein ChlgKO_03730 [Chlamydiales bacterium]
MNKPTKLLRSVFLFVSAIFFMPSLVEAGTFELPAKYKPYVVMKQAEFKWTKAKYSFKLSGAEKKSEIIAITKDGIGEIFDVLYDALPENKAKEIKRGLYNFTLNSIHSIDSISDRKKVKDMINDAFEEVKADDVDSYKQLTWYAFKSSGKLIDSAKEKMLK